MLPAVPSQTCSCSGAPLVGLVWLPRKLRGDGDGPVPSQPPVCLC